jgi:hypothetical protein
MAVVMLLARMAGLAYRSHSVSAAGAESLPRPEHMLV